MVLVNLFASVGMARSNIPPLGKLYFLCELSFRGNTINFFDTFV